MTWFPILHIPYLIHVYIPGRYILVSSVQPLVLVLARAPLAIVLHLLHQLFGKCLRDQRIPVDIGTRLKRREERSKVVLLLEGSHQ